MKWLAALHHNVAHAPRTQPITNIDDNPEVRQAVKTMPQFQSQLHEMRSREPESFAYHITRSQQA
jgi:hypothetical protein